MAAEEKRRRIEKATNEEPMTEVRRQAHRANQSKAEGNIRQRLMETLARGESWRADDAHGSSPREDKREQHIGGNQLRTAQTRTDGNEAVPRQRTNNVGGSQRDRGPVRAIRDIQSDDAASHHRSSEMIDESVRLNGAPLSAKRRKVVEQHLEHAMQYNGRQVHPSHRFGFSRGILWCWTCGAWCQNYARALTQECTKLPTRAGADALARLSKGKTPRSTMETWPNPMALEPETIPIEQSHRMEHFRRRVVV